MKRENHNGIISLWKFILCIVIAVYHGKAFFPSKTIPVFKGGYIAVEFFFLVSGFYFAKHVLKEKYNKNTIGKETFEFMWKKIKYFFPYVFIVVSMTALLYLLFYEPFNVSKFINSIWSMLLIRQFGFTGPLVVGALWYLSVMLISMYVLYPLVKKHGKNFIIIVSPLIAIFGLGYLSRTLGTLDLYHKGWIGFLCTGTVRGFCEINIGMILYLINQKLKDIKYTKFGTIVLTLLSHAILLSILFVISFVKGYVKYDFVMLLMIMAAVQIMVSEKTYDYKIMQNHFFEYLGKLSMPIFINHPFFVSIFQYVPYCSELSNSIKMSSYIFLIIVVSMLEMKLLEYLRKKQWFGISNLFVEGKRKINV